eukprot:1031290_1
MAEEEKKLKHNNDDKHSGAWRLQISSEHRLRSENLAFDIDVWYPILKKFTFETVFLPFKRREAIAIIHYYQTRYIRNAPHSVPLLTPYDIKILNELEHQISNLLSDTSYSFTSHGAFMRLCGRSPKDAEPLDHSLVRQLYDKNLDNLLQGNNPQNIKYKRTANTKLIAIAHTQWLKINHAKDAMNQLLTSERVYTDLHDWIKYGEPEQIVFRVWQSELSLDYEFRCYIYNNRMTAISQYDHYAIYPYLKQQKQHIQELMVSKWKEVHQHILQDHYCIDFGYLASKDEVIVIEISPFRRCTGSACFNWTVDRDLMYGVDPNKEIEFRLKEKLHPQIDDLVEANWELRWWTQSDPEPYWTLYDRFDEYTEPVKASKDSTIADHKYIHCCIMTLIVAALIGVSSAIWSYHRVWGIIVAILAVIVVVLYGVFIYYRSKNDVLSYDGKLDEIERPLKYMEFDPNEGHLAEIRQIDQRVNDQMYVLFVYGTLKRNFHWNHKFMSRGGELIGNAKTVDRYPLVMGDCNVPYVIDVAESEVGENILGELWHIDYETLIGLDDYEGVSKGHYKRKKINIVMMDDEDEKEIKANIYMKADVGNIDLSETELLNEYSYEYHKKYYSPIKHIQVKQLAYLGEDFSRT